MLKIFPIPAFEDNYIWIVHNDHEAIVVDPGDATPVCSYLDAHNLKLLAILCTHHHRDHIGGIQDLVELYNTPVYGPRHEKIPCMTHPLGEGYEVEISQLNFHMKVIDIPGHTLGHIAYLWDGGMFCGDTLFTCGCGKLFEGTAAQLHHSLQRLASQPDDTLVYCTHEYTESNIRFAVICEPGNSQLRQREQDTHALRAQDKPTLPSTIKLEKATNPFLRCTEPEIIQNIKQKFGYKLDSEDEAAVFTALRKWRDTY